jgi:hypothetical protein
LKAPEGKGFKMVISDEQADRIIERLRIERFLTEEESEQLCKSISIDLLRSKINKDDVQLLLELAVSKNTPWLRSLAISLMCTVRNDISVKRFLLKTWATAKDYHTRLAVMWRLLDYDELEKTIHLSIYEFIRSHWKRWLSDMRLWFEGYSVLSAVNHRLADTTFPESKAWVYLCLAMASDETDRIHALLNQHTGSSKSIVGKVANDFC